MCRLCFVIVNSIFFSTFYVFGSHIPHTIIFLLQIKNVVNWSSAQAKCGQVTKYVHIITISSAGFLSWDSPYLCFVVQFLVAEGVMKIKHIHDSLMLWTSSNTDNCLRQARVAATELFLAQWLPHSAVDPLTQVRNMAAFTKFGFRAILWVTVQRIKMDNFYSELKKETLAFAINKKKYLEFNPTRP